MDIQTRGYEDRDDYVMQRNSKCASIRLLVEDKLYKHRRLTQCYWTAKLFAVGLVTAQYLGTIVSASADGQKFCSAIEYLIEQSKSKILAIREESANNIGAYGTIFILPDALNCVVLVDLDKSSYQCIWKFPYGDERAEKTFRRFKNEMKSCIGHLAKERKDRSVNHPDIYLSYYYSLPSGQAKAMRLLCLAANLSVSHTCT